MERASPINVEILSLTESQVKVLGQVKELQIFGQGSNFHPEGLFSVEIFGPVGSEYRNRRFGYIDLRYPILDPGVYRAISTVSSFYEQIIHGKVTAAWNEKQACFEKDSSEKSSTGFSFFVKHLPKIKFLRNNSDARNFNIDLIEKAIKENKYLTRYLLVMPAGMRDYTITPSGKPEEDEINGYWRKLIAQSQLVDGDISRKTPEVYDNIFSNLQRALDELYLYLMSFLDGKNKLILGKWLSRKVFNSTRNVLTASLDTTDDMHDPNRLRSNDVSCGIYQYLRAFAPKTLFEIRNKYLKDVFVEGSQFAYVTNVKTFQKEEVVSSHIQKDYDQWTSMDGLESVIANFGNEDLRHQPLTLNRGKHYMGLIYNDGKHFRFFSDIRDLPDTLDKKHVSPITFAEMIYICIADMNGKHPGLVTRYPIQGYGGIYPAWVKFNTTLKTLRLTELDHEWKPTDRVVHTFPIRSSGFMNGMSVHQSHIAALGADHDGDTMSLVGILSDEAIEEVRTTLSNPSYYLDSSNKIIFSNSADILNATLAYMTN